MGSKVDIVDSNVYSFSFTEVICTKYLQMNVSVRFSRIFSFQYKMFFVNLYTYILQDANM